MGLNEMKIVRSSAIVLATSVAQNWPRTQVKVLRVAADGDLVFLQTVQPKMAQSPEMVIVDIFRVANGKIAEHWDTMQAVPANASNPRPMY